MAPIRRSSQRRQSLLFPHSDDPNRNFLFQPNLDPESFSPKQDSYASPTHEQHISFPPDFLTNNVTPPPSSPPTRRGSRNLSFTFVDPATPIFPLRRASKITLNGRRSSRSQAARRVVSHAAKKPEGHIPRPPNCFLLYRSWVRQQKKMETSISAEKVGKKNEQKVSVIVGTLWEDLPEEKKEIFREEARRIKLEHQARYPDYKYAPRTKKDPKAANVPKRKAKKMAPEEVGTCLEVAEEIIGRKKDPRRIDAVAGSSKDVPTTNFIPFRRSSSCPPVPGQLSQTFAGQTSFYAGPSAPAVPPPSVIPPPSRPTQTRSAKRARTSPIQIVELDSSEPPRTTRFNGPVPKKEDDPIFADAFVFQQQQDDASSTLQDDIPPRLPPSQFGLFDPGYSFPPPGSASFSSSPFPQSSSPSTPSGLPDYSYATPHPQAGPYDPVPPHVTEFSLGLGGAGAVRRSVSPGSSYQHLLSPDSDMRMDDMSMPMAMHLDHFMPGNGTDSLQSSLAEWAGLGAVYASQEQQHLAQQNSFHHGSHHHQGPVVQQQQPDVRIHEHRDFHSHGNYHQNMEYTPLEDKYVAPDVVAPAVQTSGHQYFSPAPSNSTVSSTSASTSATSTHFSSPAFLSAPHPTRAIDLGRLSTTDQYFDWTGGAGGDEHHGGHPTHHHHQDLAPYGAAGPYEPQDTGMYAAGPFDYDYSNAGPPPPSALGLSYTSGSNPGAGGGYAAERRGSSRASAFWLRKSSLAGDLAGIGLGERDGMVMS